MANDPRTDGPTGTPHDRRDTWGGGWVFVCEWIDKKGEERAVNTTRRERARFKLRLPVKQVSQDDGLGTDNPYKRGARFRRLDEITFQVPPPPPPPATSGSDGQPLMGTASPDPQVEIPHSLGLRASLHITSTAVYILQSGATHFIDPRVMI